LKISSHRKLRFESENHVADLKAALFQFTLSSVIVASRNDVLKVGGSFLKAIKPPFSWLASSHPLPANLGDAR
jgi:hypothetical protein